MEGTLASWQPFGLATERSHGVPSQPSALDASSNMRVQDGCEDMRAAQHIIQPSPSASENVHWSSLSSYAACKLRNRLDLKLTTGIQCEANKSNVEFFAGVEDTSPCSSEGNDGKTLENPPSADVDSGFSSDDSSPNPSPVPRTKLERSRTLPSALRPPTRTSSHKTVRFADSLGLDLEQRSIFDSDDWRENTLEYLAAASTQNAFRSTKVPPSRRERRSSSIGLIATNFRHRSEAEESHLTRTRRVLVHSLELIDMNVTGVIRVVNLAFDKQVTIRYSTNNWESFAETAAIYIGPHGNDGAVDSFSFFIAFPPDLPLGASCQLCVRFAVSGASYWDNNDGLNYALQCTEVASEERKHADRECRRAVNEAFGRCRSPNSSEYSHYSSRWQDNFTPFTFPSLKLGGWRHSNFVDTYASSSGQYY